MSVDRVRQHLADRMAAEPSKSECYGIFFAALTFSSGRIASMPPESVQEFTAMLAKVVGDTDPCPREIRRELVSMGWWIREMN